MAQLPDNLSPDRRLGTRKSSSTSFGSSHVRNLVDPANPLCTVIIMTRGCRSAHLAEGTSGRYVPRSTPAPISPKTRPSTRSTEVEHGGLARLFCNARTDSRSGQQEQPQKSTLAFALYCYYQPL